MHMGATRTRKRTYHVPVNVRRIGVPLSPTSAYALGASIVFLKFIVRIPRLLRTFTERCIT